jgi:hypothetical protein
MTDQLESTVETTEIGEADLAAEAPPEAIDDLADLADLDDIDFDLDEVENRIAPLALALSFRPVP